MYRMRPNKYIFDSDGFFNAFFFFFKYIFKQFYILYSERYNLNIKIYILFHNKWRISKKIYILKESEAVFVLKYFQDGRNKYKNEVHFSP